MMPMPVEAALDVAILRGCFASSGDLIGAVVPENAIEQAGLGRGGIVIYGSAGSGCLVVIEGGVENGW